MDNYTLEDVLHYSEGDIVSLHGKRYRLLKKTSTAISVQRYYWFDALADWVSRRFVGNKVL